MEGFFVPEASKITSILIHSETRGYGPSPELGDEISQTFSVSSDGYVEFTRNIFWEDCYEMPADTFRIFIGKPSTKRIFELISDAVTHMLQSDGCDVRFWNMVITDSSKKQYEFYGVISDDDLHTGRFKLSKLIRRTLIASRSDFMKNPFPVDLSTFALFDGGDS